jgi:predicted ribosomally synthesized peptide with SipW-like signal peptide
MALGCVLSLAGATGVFAVFTDRATTGDHSVESADVGQMADLQLAIATPSGGGFTCGTFSEDLVTATLTATDVPHTFGGGSSPWMCLRNVGAASVGVTASVLDLTDIDTSCTGDESDVDATCGEAAGELSEHLTVVDSVWDCGDSSIIHTGLVTPIDAMVTTPSDLVTLAANATVCVRMNMTYSATPADAVIAQSDTVTWRFAFDGATAE